MSIDGHLMIGMDLVCQRVFELTQLLCAIFQLLGAMGHKLPGKKFSRHLLWVRLLLVSLVVQTCPVPNPYHLLTTQQGKCGFADLSEQKNIAYFLSWLCFIYINWMKIHSTDATWPTEFHHPYFFRSNAPVIMCNIFLGLKRQWKAYFVKQSVAWCILESHVSIFTGNHIPSPAISHPPPGTIEFIIHPRLDLCLKANVLCTIWHTIKDRFSTYSI